MRARKLLSRSKSNRTCLPALVFATGALALLYGQWSVARAAQGAGGGASAIASELRHTTQLLLDGITSGDAAVWDKWLDPAVLMVDENDIVRGKAETLAEIKPLAPGLVGHLYIDDFRVAVRDNVAVVTHEDNETLDYHG
jgi:hypothetical protein